MKKYSLIMVGCGRISKNHVKAIMDNSDRINLVGVCDVVEDRAREASRSAGDVEWFTDIEPEDGIAGPFLKSCYVVARKLKHAFDCEYVTMLIRGTRVPHLHMLLIPSVRGEENLLDKTLALHHFAQVRMKPPFSDAELDQIAEQVKDARV